MSYQFAVVGLFRLGFHEYDTRLAYVSLEDARKLGGAARGTIYGIELRFDDPRQALKMEKEVVARLGYEPRIMDWETLNHNLFMALEMQKLIIALFLMIIIIVAAFNIVASLTMIVLSKVREMAILGAMGARKGAVMRLFVSAGSLVGFVGVGPRHRLRRRRVRPGPPVRLPAGPQGLLDRHVAGADHRGRAPVRRRQHPAHLHAGDHLPRSARRPHEGGRRPPLHLAASRVPVALTAGALEWASLGGLPAPVARPWLKHRRSPAVPDRAARPRAQISRPGRHCARDAGTPPTAGPPIAPLRDPLS